MRLTIEVDAVEVTAVTYEEGDGFLPGFHIHRATVLVLGHELDVLEALESNPKVYSLVLRELELEYEKLQDKEVDRV